MCTRTRTHTSTLFRGLPWNLKGGEEVRLEVDCDEEHQAEEDQEQQTAKDARPLYITRKMVEKYGESEGCIGCRALMKRAGCRAHHEACRKRMEEKLDEEEHSRRAHVIQMRRQQQ